MPEIIILAGPNGAGKSTFAEQFLRDQEDIAYVNADQKAAELARIGGPIRDLDVAAARFMLREIEMLVDARQDLMIETTLASLSYARKILHRLGLPPTRECRGVHSQSSWTGCTRRSRHSPRHHPPPIRTEPCQLGDLQEPGERVVRL